VSGDGRRPGRDELAVGLLAFGAGAMDALSFVALGEVFTAAMTGNAVLLGIAIGQGRLAAAARSVAALAGFVAGAAVACRPLIGAPRGAWSRGVVAGFAVEAGFLALFALLLAAAGRAGGTLPMILILLAAAGMGAQSVVARHLDFPGITTTVFTGTLVDIVATLTGVTAPPGAPPKFPTRVPWRTAREIASFVVYIAGAAAGGGLALLHAWIAGLLPLAALLAALATRGRAARP
jgi:uncharacterized membrane protein YoaK (UPF0700 family)